MKKKKFHRFSLFHFFEKKASFPPKLNLIIGKSEFNSRICSPLKKKWSPYFPYGTDQTRLKNHFTQYLVTFFRRGRVHKSVKCLGRFFAFFEQKGFFVKIYKKRLILRVFRGFLKEAYLKGFIRDFRISPNGAKNSYF